LLARAFNVHIAALKNVALCHLKEKSYVAAIDTCNRVLKFAPCEKTLRRRCDAKTGYGLYDDAIADWEEIKRLNPECAEEAEKKIAQLAKRQKAAAGKNKDFMKSMFKSSFEPDARA
jgi:predicted TPR repeat methyltransferase